MKRSDLEKLRKEKLQTMARELRIRGRSTMTKPELIDALAEEGEPPAAPVTQVPSHQPRHLPIPGVSPEEREEASVRRSALNDRLARLVESKVRCSWSSLEGHPCGLPAVGGDTMCGLHGGGDIYDVAIPLTGHLGFDTWPTLWRHMFLSTYDIDPVGLDPVVAEMIWLVLNGLYFDYFRVHVEGIENVPMEGPGVLVANHGGAALPYDGAMLALSVLNEAIMPRRVRIVGTEIFNMLPTISHLYRKAGAAYAARDDAGYLLDQGHLLGVFPEGERGFMKPVWQAYQVQRFGRGGFVELAEKAGAPIVPVAIVGSEEVHPALSVSKRLASLVRMVFPQQRVEEMAIFLNPVPLPVRWHLKFLPPLPPEQPGEEPDPLRLLERTEDVRRRIQLALDGMLASRRTAF